MKLKIVEDKLLQLYASNNYNYTERGETRDRGRTP